MAEIKEMPKIALGAWAWGNDGTFGGNLTPETLRSVFDTAMKRRTESLGYCVCIRDGNFGKGSGGFPQRSSQGQLSDL